MIDTHTHVWGPSTDEHPWVNEALIERVGELPVDDVYTAGHLLDDMDDAGIDEAVVVDFPIDDWRANEYTLETVREHDRLDGIVTFDVFADDAADRLERVMAVDGVLGVRLGVVFPYDEMWVRDDPSADWLYDAIDETAVWQTAAETDAAVHLLVRYEQLDQVYELVRAHPDVTVVVDHMARISPDVSPDEAFGRLADAAAVGDVVVKASAVSVLSDRPFPHPDLHPHVDWLVDTLGRDRVAWGSDYPFVSDVADYDQTHGWLERVPELSTADRKWLTERTFQRRIRGP